MVYRGARLRSGVGMALILGLIVPSASWAQARKAKTGAPRVETEIEQITVTAQKREENIQEIPISVTALTGAALQEKGVASFSDLTQSIPNLYVAGSTNGAANFGVSLRGPYQTNATFAQDSKTGLYVDGVYIAKLLGSNMDLEDLERVEVARGPQGTLFGRNNVGGAVQLVTRKPTEERSITVGTEVGNFNAFKGRVTLNVPIVGDNGYFQSDALGTISLRTNAVYKSHDGFYRNQSPTNVRASGGSELSDLNRVFNMTAVRWQPTKDLTVDYAFEYHRYRQTPTAFQVIHLIPGSPVFSPQSPLYLGPYVRPQRVSAIGNNAILGTGGTQRRFSDDGNNKIHFLTAAWDVGQVGPLGNLTAKSISHFRSQFTDGDLDLDSSPLRIAEFRRHTRLETWSEEVQLLGTAPRVNYTLGLYYYGERSSQHDTTMLFGGGLNTNGRNRNKNDSYATFGQATVTPPVFGDRLSLTGGIRYTVDHIQTKRAFRCVGAFLGPPGVNLCNLGIPGLVNFNAIRARNFSGGDAITFTGNASFQWTDDVMTYFQASRGYQSGYVNADATDVRLMNIVAPEQLLMYEVGVKSQWWDSRVRVNVAGFYSDFTDQVINTFRSSAGGGVNVELENAGKSKFYGVELEAVAIPWRGLEVTATYAYLNAKFEEFLQQAFDEQGRPVFDSAGRPVEIDVADFRPFPLSSPHKLTLGLTYTAPATSSGTFSAHIDTFWQNDMVLFNQPLPGGLASRQINGWAYAVVNGRLQFAEIPLARGSLDVAVFGKNLFDRKYRTFGIDFGNSLGWQGAIYGEPRTFGLGLTYNFSA